MGSKALTVIRSDDKIYDIEVKDVDGAVVDISNYGVKFTVRNNYRDSTYKIYKTTPTQSGISLIDPTNGKARITLTGADTTIEPGKYVYDVELTDTSNRRITVIQDNFLIKLDVTR